MRGTLLHGGFQIRPWGIIPAYAGNTPIPDNVTLVYRDHPRVCGEHCELWRDGASTWGSSPRMRGTRQLSDNALTDGGIIPAYAGNTDGPRIVRW